VVAAIADDPGHRPTGTSAAALHRSPARRGAFPVSLEDAIPLLKTIILRERQDGCPMASECLIEPALRRWRSYERRFQRHKDKSLKHRAHDLEKGLLEIYPDGGYDPGCIRHLAESFAAALLHGASDPFNARNYHHGLHSDNSNGPV
jgi:hypothetical protein